MSNISFIIDQTKVSGIPLWLRLTFLNEESFRHKSPFYFTWISLLLFNETWSEHKLTRNKIRWRNIFDSVSRNFIDIFHIIFTFITSLNSQVFTTKLHWKRTLLYLDSHCSFCWSVKMSNSKWEKMAFHSLENSVKLLYFNYKNIM